MDQSSTFLRDFIRRIHDEIRLYSNYYSAIRTISTALNQSIDTGRATHLSSADHLGDVRESSHHEKTNSGSKNIINLEGQIGEKNSAFFADHAAASQNSGQGYQESVKKGKGAQNRWAFSLAQKYRLLLLRADAYSAVKQHEKALEDATAALQLSYNRSPEAYFIIGRELLRLFRVSEAVYAFEKAESLLQLMLATNESLFEVTEKNFWAQRGFNMADVERLKLDRREFVQQEQAAYLESARRVGGAEVEEDKTSALLSSTFVSATQDEGLGWNNAQLLSWRQLAKEAKAFLTMHASHVLPISVLQTTLVLLDRRMSSVRSGVVVCVENATSKEFCLVGCASPDAAYNSNMRFPNTIPSGHCGIALLQPRGWSGFVSSVCYEVGENGVCCYFCFEVSFMGSIKSGVRFTKERGCVELAHAFSNSNSSKSEGSASGFLSAESVKFKIPSSSMWLQSHIAPLPCGTKLKVLTATRGATRVVSFSVIEVLPVRLRAVELLPALEFAGPAVLKKMSAVNRRFRELINNFPPQMFYGSCRSFYPDYCLLSDRRSSPWIVHDKEPVMWQFLFDGHFVNRSSYLVTDSANNRNEILFFSSERNGSAETTVYYGDKRSPIAQIKCSWVPFSNTLYFCTPSGRAFAYCFVNRDSQLTLAWDGANRKSKLEEVEYVMQRRETARRDVGSCRINGNSNIFSVTPSTDVNSSDAMPASSSTNSMLTSSTVSHFKGSRDLALETYAILRPQRVGGAGGGHNDSCGQANAGMELVAEFSICAQSAQKSFRGTKIGEILLYAGVDALLATLMAYCRFQWEI